MKVAVIIVTYNSTQEIAGCLRSLIGHTSPFPTTITVVDNASTDGTLAVHESLSLQRFERPWVQVLLPFRMPRRGGRAGAR